MGAASGQSQVDTVHGNYTADAATRLTSRDGRILGHYRAKAVGASNYVNDSVALENAYIRALTEVLNGMPSDPVLIT